MNLQKRNNLLILTCSCIILFLCICSLWMKYMTYLIPVIAIITNIFLYKDAPQTTQLSKQNRKVDVYRSMVILNIFVMLMVLLSLIMESILPQYQESLKNARYFLFIFFMLMFGNQAPRIPFNRRLGLRLSWCIQDEASWRYTHRMVGYCSFISAVCMMIMYILDKQYLGLIIMITGLVLVPSILSYIEYHKRNPFTEVRKAIFLIPLTHFICNLALYPYYPDAFPMQLSYQGDVNYTLPKLYAIALMAVIEVLLIFFYQKSDVKRQWILISLLALLFTCFSIYILIMYGNFNI